MLVNSTLVNELREESEEDDELDEDVFDELEDEEDDDDDDVLDDVDDDGMFLDFLFIDCNFEEDELFWGLDLVLLEVLLVVFFVLVNFSVDGVVMNGSVELWTLLWTVLLFE